MNQSFANYQVTVDINHDLPKNCCEVTVKLSDNLAEFQGWKKKNFICRKRKLGVGESMKPIHKTDDNLEVIVRDSYYGLKLNTMEIRLFQIS